MFDVIDFFCGCGGTSEGLKQAGMNILLGLDFDKDALQTFARNHPDAQVINRDIREVSVDDLLRLIPGLAKKRRKRPLLFSACAPCQPFSKQNRQKSSDDRRISLLSECERFVVALEPDYILIENVPGIRSTSADEGPLDRFLSQLKALRYQEPVVQVLKAERFGVPQLRRRLIVMVAKNGRAVNELSETHGPGKENLVTVRDTIAKYPSLEAGQTDAIDALHRAASVSPLNLKRLRATPVNGGRLDWNADLRLSCHSKPGHTDVYGRMNWDRPAPTLTTRCVSVSNGRFAHPEQDRGISLREAAALQTFPEDFQFAGATISIAKQIGAAAPPLLAKKIGENFTRHYREQNGKNKRRPKSKRRGLHGENYRFGARRGNAWSATDSRRFDGA